MVFTSVEDLYMYMYMYRAYSCTCGALSILFQFMIDYGITSVLWLTGSAPNVQVHVQVHYCIDISCNCIFKAHVQKQTLHLNNTCIRMCKCTCNVRVHNNTHYAVHTPVLLNTAKAYQSFSTFLLYVLRLCKTDSELTRVTETYKLSDTCMYVYIYMHEHVHICLCK